MGMKSWYRFCIHTVDSVKLVYFRRVCVCAYCTMTYHYLATYHGGGGWIYMASSIDVCGYAEVLM